MPISPTAAGTDRGPAPYSRPGSSAGTQALDYGTRDRGPFRLALARAGAPAASAEAPAPAQASPTVYEGPQALAALQRDLLGAGAVVAQESLPEEAEAIAVPAGPAVGEEAAGTDAPTHEPRNSWRDDETKGRRLGDRPVPPSDGKDGVETWLFGEDGFGFDDLIDVINPLQHIPVVSSIYRWITGDEISPAANVAGGALFGGPIGLAGAVASVAIEEVTGDDIGGHAMAMLFGDEESPGSDTPADATNLAALPAPAEADPAAIPELPFFPSETAPAGLAQAGAAPEAVPVPEAAPGDPIEFPEGPQAAAGPSALMFIPANEALALAPAAGTPSAGGPGSPADAAIAAQMMLALDKYEALTRERNTAAGAAPAAGSVPGSTAPGTLFDSRF